MILGMKNAETRITGGILIADCPGAIRAAIVNHQHFKVAESLSTDAFQAPAEVWFYVINRYYY
jgi:hypothetical protein